MAEVNVLDSILSVSFWLGGAVGMVVAFSKSYLGEKGKNYANKEDFNFLKDQLSQNTRAVKEIEGAISERGWINQQVWLRRQDSYEKIFTYLSIVLKYVTKEVGGYFEYYELYHNYPGVHNSSHHYDQTEEWSLEMSMHGLAMEKAQADWKSDKEAYEAKKKDVVEIAKSKELKSNYEQAMVELKDFVELKAIYLNEDIPKIVSELDSSLIATHEYEDWGDHFERLYSHTAESIKALREICKFELGIVKVLSTPE